MARLIGPDEASRVVQTIVGGVFRGKATRPVQLWADQAATVPANVLTLAGQAIPNSTVTVDATSMLPLIQFPDNVDVIYATCDGGPAWPVYARTADRLDVLGSAVDTFGIRANNRRYGTPGTRQAFINALDDAETRGNYTVVHIPAGMTIDVQTTLSMSGRTCQILGAGAGLSGLVPKASVIRASSQTGPVLDFTGYIAPSNFMGKVTPLAQVLIVGSGAPDPTKNNAGVRIRYMQSATFRDIAIMNTGGPCLELAESPGAGAYLCDFERIIMSTPVSARDNDVPYFYANEPNGNRFRGFGFRSVIPSGDVGASGAAIVESNAQFASRFNLFDAWWYEYLHPSAGSTLFHHAGNGNVIRDFQWWDIREEPAAAGTGTSYIRLVPPPSLDLGGNEIYGMIPGDQNVATWIDTGVDVRQSRNRIMGVKGYRAKNVTIAAGVDYTYVHLGGGEAAVAGAPSAFVNNSAATHNVLIDEVNGDEYRNGTWARQAGVRKESGAPDVQTFQFAGTWTKPAGAVTVQITAIGAGGGGGSGRRGAAGSACSGGGGGAGGAIVSVTLPASALAATHAVTVGTGGTGGAAVTTDDTNGANGAAGGNSVVANVLVAYGGLGGGGGNNSTGAAGSSLAPANANGAFGNTVAGGSAGNAVSGGFGGAGGGGINTSNVAANGGAQGFATYAQGVTSGTAGVVDGAPAGNGNNAPTGSPLPGGGAGGGAASVTTAAGAGGNGGRYGSGGGGGGASRNGNNSGAGGNGANGIVQIVTFF
ncbi:glycine-rich domain-containing protein [Micromonospora chalcea]